MPWEQSPVPRGWIQDRVWSCFMNTEMIYTLKLNVQLFTEFSYLPYAEYFIAFRTLLQRHKIFHPDNIYIIFYNWNIFESGVNHHHPNPNPYNTLHIKFLVLKKKLIQAIFMYILCLNKKGYGCKWTWQTVQHYTWTQIKVKKQYFYCCSTFQSHVTYYLQVIT